MARKYGQGHVAEHGNGKWRVFIYDTETKRYRTKVVAGTRDEAERVKTQMLLAVRERAAVKVAAAGTVKEHLEAWVAARRHDWSPSHLADVRRQIDQKIGPRIGNIKVDELTAGHLDRFYADLKSSGAQNGGPLSDSSVHRAHVALSGALSAAERWGDIATSPVRQTTRTKKRRGQIDPPTPAQVMALIDAEQRPMWSALLVLAATTGARRSQLLGVKWGDIRSDPAEISFKRSVTSTGGVVNVADRTKTDRPYARTLSVEAVSALDRWQQNCGIDTGFVFCGRDELGQYHGVVPMSPERVKSWWPRLRQKAGADSVRFHDLRHFVATQLLAGGVDPVTVAASLGHSSPQMILDRYAHFIPAREKAATEKLDHILWGDQHASGKVANP